MQQIGTLGSFDIRHESFDSYVERVNCHFSCNDIGRCPVDADDATRTAAATKKVCAFISVVGLHGYADPQALCKPALPSEKTFEELCQLLRNHYKSKVIEVTESFKFHAYKQAAG